MPLSDADKSGLGLAARDVPARGTTAVAAVTLLAVAVFDEVTSWFIDPELRKPMPEAKAKKSSSRREEAVWRDWRDIEWRKFLRLAVILRTVDRLLGALRGSTDLAKFRTKGLVFGLHASTHEAVHSAVSELANWVQVAMFEADLLQTERPEPDPLRSGEVRLRPEETLAMAEERLGVAGARCTANPRHEEDLQRRFRMALAGIWRHWQRRGSPRARFEAVLQTGDLQLATACRSRLDAERLRVREEGPLDYLPSLKGRGDDVLRCLFKCRGTLTTAAIKESLDLSDHEWKQARRMLLDNRMMVEVGPGSGRGAFSLTALGRERAGKLLSA